jgi:hypothetical protein
MCFDTPSEPLLLLAVRRPDRSRVRLRIPGAGNRKAPFHFWESRARIGPERWGVTHVANKVSRLRDIGPEDLVIKQIARYEYA